MIMKIRDRCGKVDVGRQLVADFEGDVFNSRLLLRLDNQVVRYLARG